MAAWVRYSISAQRKMLAEYARSRGFEIVCEFIDIESAKNPGRKEFGNMLRLLETDGSIRIVLVEKTDRLYLNRAFELYATGRESLTTLRKNILENHGLRSRAYLENILKNPFYVGQFVWRGVIYDGTHAPLISLDLFQRVQDTLAARNKPARIRITKSFSAA